MKSYVQSSVIRNILVGLVLALIIAAVMARPDPEPEWATLSEFHAAWNPDKDVIFISIKIDKKLTCDRTVVKKDLQPLLGNDVVSSITIPVNGHLPKKIQERDPGQHIIFDEAKPRKPVGPGDYLLTMIAICETSPGEGAAPTAKQTSPITALITRPDPKGTKRG